MNILIVEYVPRELSGVKKKISYQVDALKRLGASVDHYEMVDSTFLKNGEAVFVSPFSGRFGRKVNELLLAFKVFSDSSFFAYDFSYCRYNRMLPWTPFRDLLIKCKANKCFVEIPAYPFDKEYSLWSFTSISDRFFRLFLRFYVEKIFFYGERRSRVFGVKARRLFNGVDVLSLKLKAIGVTESKPPVFLFVGNFSSWHGLDRLLFSIFHHRNSLVGSKFILVGDGPICADLKRLAKSLNIEGYVVFTGSMNGLELDAIFDRADVGLCSLGLHRIGHDDITTLKPAEYTARGLPFILANQDPRFESNLGFIYKASNDEAPIDFPSIMNWWKSFDMDRYGIRSYALQNLTWDKQMVKVIEEFE